MPGKTGKRAKPPTPCARCKKEITDPTFNRERDGDYHRSCWQKRYDERENAMAMRVIKTATKIGWEILAELRAELKKLAPHSSDSDLEKFGIREARYALDKLAKNKDVASITYAPVSDRVVWTDYDGHVNSFQVSV